MQPKSRPQVKSQLSYATDSKNLQGRHEKSSELDKSKMKKSNTIKKEKKTIYRIPQSTELIEECDGLRTTLCEKGNEDEKVKVEDEDKDEEEYDKISFGDEDDEESADEIGTEDEFEYKEVGFVDDSDMEEVEKPPTVTDHSSADGSLKREIEHIRSEHSDVESDCAKETDRTNSTFTIPKKNELAKKSSSLVIPKKVIPKKVQSSLSSGISLISNVARQAMLDKKNEKMKQSSTRYTKKPLYLSHSPSKDINRGRKKEMCLTDQGSPSLKRKTFSDLCHSPSQHIRSPASTDPQRTPSAINNGNNQRSALSRAMLSPKHSFKDRYSIEQRRERELYRNSNEYTARGENYSSQESSDIHDHSIRRLNDCQDLAQRSPSFDRRRGIEQLDQNSSPRNSRSRTFDCDSRTNQYDDDGCRSRHYDRSYDEDMNVQSHGRSSDFSSRSVSNFRAAEYEQSNDELFSGRRMNTGDAYRNDYQRFDDDSRRNEDESNVHASRRHEEDYNRRERGSNDRDIGRDDHRYRFDNEYEQRFSSHSDDNEFHREDDRCNKRRRNDSGRRREERRKRRHDGSDEYSRRLDGYNHIQEHNDGRQDRYNR